MSKSTSPYRGGHIHGNSTLPAPEGIERGSSWGFTTAGDAGGGAIHADVIKHDVFSVRDEMNDGISYNPLTGEPLSAAATGAVGDGALF